MYVKTTMNIRKEHAAMLEREAEKMNISKSRLVSMLLQKYFDANKGGGRAFQQLKYQERDQNVQWKTSGLYLRKDIYELWCDARKVFKLSASFVIALAIEMYLQDIINSYLTDGEVYNNTGFYYTDVRYTKYSMICMTMRGQPEKKILEKLLNL